MANGSCESVRGPISFRLSLAENIFPSRKTLFADEAQSAKNPANDGRSRLTKQTTSRILRDPAEAETLLPNGKWHSSCSGASGQPIFDNLVMKLLLSSAERDRFLECFERSAAIKNGESLEVFTEASGADQLSVST